MQLLEDPAKNFVRVERATAVLSTKQDQERLLCRDCEGRFSRRERYVKQMVRQVDDSFPLLQHAKQVGSPDGVLYAANEFHLCEMSSVDHEALAYFAVSVIWRASVSAGFRNVDLGPHAATSAEYLREDAGFPSTAMLMIELANPPIDWRPPLIPPYVKKADGLYRIHEFVIGSVAFRLLVGSAIPPEFRRFSFLDQHVVVVSEGRNLLRPILDSAERAIPKGRLAKRS